MQTRTKWASKQSHYFILKMKQYAIRALFNYAIIWANDEAHAKKIFRNKVGNFPIFKIKLLN